MVLDVRNPLMQRPRRIKGKSGTRFKVSSPDREANHAMHVEPESDPFLNGTFKRVDVPTAEVVEQMPDYNKEQALSDKDLLVTFTSSGNAFHAKVKKFTERNVRRMLALAESNSELVSCWEAFRICSNWFTVTGLAAQAGEESMIAARIHPNCFTSPLLKRTI